MHTDAPAPSPTASQPRTLKQAVLYRFRRLLTFLIVLYIGWCTALYFLQDRLLFLNAAAGAGIPENRFPPNIERIWVTLGDGSRVEAWFSPAPNATAKLPAPAVFFAHGNAELIDHQYAIVESYNSRGISVLLAEYPGYGRSTGRPSQSSIGEAFRAFHAALIAHASVDASHILYHGRSLGTGAVSQLAITNPPVAMVLESPFRSIASMSWRYAAPPFLASNPFHTDDVLAQLTAPVVILHGTTDLTVPIEHGRALAAIAHNATLLEFDTAHNDDMLNGDTRAWTAIEAMLLKVGALPASRVPR